MSLNPLMIVVLGVALGALGAYLLPFLWTLPAERRAVAAFREAYRSAAEGAKEYEAMMGRPVPEWEVVAYAAETLRVRADIKCGRHRFGSSASEIVKRIEDEQDRDAFMTRWIAVDSARV